MGAEQILIRRISLDEIEIFRRIRLEALHCEPASFASRFEDWVVLSDRDWRQRLHDPVFVAFDEDRPVGVMGLLRQHPAKMAHRATLVMVYVRASFRGTTLAGNLLDAVVDFARGEGIWQLELAVNVENLAASHFYHRHGFIEVGRIPSGLLDHDREIDDVIMVRRLRG
ncbi:GNAT family N-acetyltransferase [Phyllobacterium sp. YR531]|uniref:GNAT family N-acetyltransferase n=1 Tax=Phyllobacterium sp. YR531 TaxID=1144343 RepID=UPI00026FA96B|nr:GNAT family N-acetyltransferase [Phyllobacterium sp. YR531]EJN05980.1 sortase-like acyltransferase [Phyllobacterium sp. YR531]